MMKPHHHSQATPHQVPTSQQDHEHHVSVNATTQQSPIVNSTNTVTTEADKTQTISPVPTVVFPTEAFYRACELEAQQQLEYINEKSSLADLDLERITSDPIQQAWLQIYLPILWQLEREQFYLTHKRKFVNTLAVQIVFVLLLTILALVSQQL